MEGRKHHIVIIPFPAQGHINPMLKLANMLHSKGFYIAFVHTQFNYDRLLTSLGSDHPFNRGDLDGFRFETIPDGLPPDNKRGVHDISDLILSLPREAKSAFKALLIKLMNSRDVPPVSCVIADTHVCFPFEVGTELGIGVRLFYASSACSMLGFLHYDQLVSRGLFPLQDDSCFTNAILTHQ